MKVCVIGAGVIGLTTAVRCAEEGWDVTVLAAEVSPGTTSDVAGAIWFPYKVASPRAAHWGERTYRAFVEMSERAETGVRMCGGVEFPEGSPQLPEWHRFVRGFRPLAREELPPGRQNGFTYTVPTIEMPVYLAYLKRRLEAAGGRVEVRRVASLDEVLRERGLVVHCAGLGARELARDESVYPVRGEVLRVEAAGPDRFLLDDANPDGITYILPRRNDWILGGTCEEGESSVEPSARSAAEILGRCAAWVPALRQARILEHRVGLRPARATVRFELEARQAGRILHSYGHGGAGVTLSWGCADEALETLRKL